jgi:DNA polymerase-3 subunit delta'
LPFSSTIGHRRIVSLLSRAVAQNRLPPSLLLAGPSGVGKRRVAMAVAAAVNCLQPRQSGEFQHDACGECATCKRIARGVHPDVILIEPGETGTIKIEQVRDVIDRSGYRPFEGRRRAVVIDEADAMVHAAQNALLKTLEEPPSASIFILVSSMPDMLLPTVVSRCPRLRFGPLSVAEVVEILVRDHDYTQAEARVAAADADGSVGRALSAESADLTEARAAAQQILEQAARTTDASRLVDAVKDVVVKKGSAGSERDQLAACLRAAASLLRDLGLMAARADASTIANTDLQPQLTALSRSYDGERATRAYAAVDEALAALERNASPKVVVDWLVLQI